MILNLKNVSIKRYKSTNVINAKYDVISSIIYIYIYILVYIYIYIYIFAD